jgi:glycosyltransferase involved in cell wall biosynthesis
LHTRLPTVAHVPMALSTPSSTLLNVARQLGRAYSRLGGRSSIVLSDNRGASVPELTEHYVDYTQKCPRQWFTRRELAMDVLAGAAGLPRPYYGRLYDPAVAAITAYPADIVLLYEGHYASATLPRWQDVRSTSELCLYVHNGLSRSYGRRELLRLVSYCDRVIFCAEHLRASTERRMGRTDSRLSVIANGVDELFFRPPRTSPHAFEVVFAGNLSPEKGTHVLLEAIADLERRHGVDDVTVTIIGASNYGIGPMSEYEQRLRRMASDLKSRVEFTGWASRARVAEVFGRAAVVCVPSLYDEPFGLVVLEALASGTPVAISDSPGPLEVIDGVGLVHGKGDFAGLADHLYALATDQDRWQGLSDAGAVRARRFTWDAAIRGITKLPQVGTLPA